MKASTVFSRQYNSHAAKQRLLAILETARSQYVTACAEELFLPLEELAETFPNWVSERGRMEILAAVARKRLSDHGVEEDRTDYVTIRSTTFNVEEGYFPEKRVLRKTAQPMVASGEWKIIRE